MAQIKLEQDLNVIQQTPIELTMMGGDLNIIQKLADEPNDTDGLTSSELKERFDRSGNLIKTYLNETLIPEILAGDATEKSRAAAETGRVEAEKARALAETGRAEAEGLRTQAEVTRETKEAAREAAEKGRADETAGIVTQATHKANFAKAHEQNAKTYTEGGRLWTYDESTGNFGSSSRGALLGAKNYAETARALAEGGSYILDSQGPLYNAVGARGFADEARAYAESGSYETLVGPQFQETRETVIVEKGAKQYAQDSKVYAHGDPDAGIRGAEHYQQLAEAYANGGKFPVLPGEVVLFDTPICTAGAKGFAQKAKAYAEGGSYVEVSENYGDKTPHTIEKGAKQHAADAERSAKSAKVSETAAAGSAAIAKTAADNVVTEEAARVAAEAQRQRSEQARIQAESARVQGEASRMEEIKRFRGLAETAATEAAGFAEAANRAAGIAEAEAERAAVPAVKGVYNVVLQDRATGERYALIVKQKRLYLLGVNPTVEATTIQLIDSSTGAAFDLVVDNHALILEEV